MRKGDLRVFLTFVVLLKLVNSGSVQNKLKATRKYPLEKRRLLFESKSGNKLTLQRRIGRDVATKNFSKKIRPGEDNIGLRSTISKAEDKGFIERLTDDIHGLVQLLKSRKGDFGEDTSDKRDSSAKGNGLSFDLGFIVDGSKVIDEQGSGNFRKCLEFVKEILRSFQVTLNGVHAGLITYGQTSRLNFNFDTVLDQASIESTIDSVSYPGTESHTGNALEMAMAKLFPHSGRQNVPHILVVITGSSSQDEVESSAEEIRAGGVKIFCVGVGGRYDQSQLETIASSPSDTYVITTEFDALRNVIPLLSSRITNVLGESTGKPTQAPPDNILLQGGIVEAKIDLGFLIDGSGTVGEQNYRMSLQFMKTIYSMFWTRFGSIHVGFMVYGATPRLIFDLDNKYMGIAEINSAIDSAVYPGGETAAAGEALKAVKAHLYGSKHHDSYRRILVVIIGSTSADDVFLGAEMLKANKVKVLCVGVGNQYERNQMDGIASEPTADNVLTVASYPGLTSLTQTLVDKIEEARTTYIPPQNTSKPRFQRNVSQPGQSLGQTGQGPSTGSTPGIISPQPGQIRPTAATLPSASATVKPTPTVTSQPRPVPGVNGEKPVNAATTNRPTSKNPLRPEGPIVLPSQGLPSVPVEDSKLDLLFLLDGSSSLQKPGFQASIEFMKKVYSNFPIGEDAAHVGMVIYGNKPRVVFSLTEGENKQSTDKKMLSAIYPYSDRSYLGKGLRAAKESVFDVSARPGGHQVLLVLSGGKSTDETKTTSRALRDSGVTIFAIGIGNMADVNKLRDIVTAPEEDHLRISNVEDLDRLLSPTVQNIRAVITKPVAESGPADIKMDLGFLLDVNTAHFRPDHFGNVLNSIKSTYAPFAIGKDKTRIGIVTFGGRPRVAVSLEQYSSRQSLDTAVGQIFLSAGPSFLGQGLEVVKRQLFRGKTRPNTPKIVVVVTGGESVDDVVGPSTELKDLNTTIFCVGVGHNVNKEELNVMATSPYHVTVAIISYRETVGDNIGARIRKGIQVDLCFMVDGSRNVLESEFKRYLDIVKYIYSAFPVSQEDVHVALGVISSNPEIIFSFDKYFDKPSLDMAVNSVEYPRTPQDLNTGQSLVVVKETLYSKSTRKGSRQVLVLVVSDKSHDDFFDPVRRLRDCGVEIFCFGLGRKVDAIELAEIATAPANKHIVVDALDNLPRGARKFIDQLQIAKVEYDDKQIPNLPQTSKRKGVAIDLVILVEGSENTKPEDFQQIKEIVKAIYYSFPVSQKETHVALEVFARETQIIFSLNKHYDHKSMDEDLDAMSYLPGPSMTGNALSDVKTKIIELDSRPNVPLVLITVMTGKPNDEIEGIANELKMTCVLMFALGLTSSYSPQSLNQVSGEPHSEYVLISETFPEAHLVAQKMAGKIKKVVSVAKSRSQRSVQPGDLKLDIAFVVSNCRNTPTDSFIQQLDLVSSLHHSFLETLRKRRMAIISVSNGAKVVQDLTTSSTNLSTIKSTYVQPKGLCTFGRGLEAIKSLFKAKGVRGVPQVAVVLFTGKSDDDVSKPSKELQEAGVLMYTIGLSNTVNESSASAMGSEPVSEYFISSPGFPNSASTKEALINKLESVIQIWRKLVCIPASGGCNNSSFVNKPLPGSRPCQLQPQNATRPPANPGSVDRKPSPNNSTLPQKGARMGSVDLVFLVEGSDAVNESFFRTLLDIVRDTLSRFPISVSNTHVAVAIYSMQTQTVVNLKDTYDSNKIKDMLDSITKPTGGCTAGKALQAVKNDIFIKNGRSGVSRVLLHLMCSQSLDDVIQPAKELREIGVKIVAAGACPQANKAELCNIGSPPLCKNSVFMQTLKPPSSPGKELADRLRQGIPEQNITQPSIGPVENNTNQPSGLMQPSMPSPWNSLSVGPIFPLVPSLIPVHPPQPLSPAPNIWNYEIPIQKNPVLPDPYTVQDTSFLYSTACADYDPACSAYGVNGYCDGPAIGFSSDYLLKMCKKSCGFCKTDKDFISSGTWIKKARIPNGRLYREVPQRTNSELLQTSSNMT